jgi:hypothetical protein
VFGNKENYKNDVVVFMEDSGSMRKDLEMCPSARDGDRTVVVMDKSSKSSLLDGGGQSMDDNERVGG